MLLTHSLVDTGPIASPKPLCLSFLCVFCCCLYLALCFLHLCVFYFHHPGMAVTCVCSSLPSPSWPFSCLCSPVSSLSLYPLMVSFFPPPQSHVWEAGTVPAIMFEARAFCLVLNLAGRWVALLWPLSLGVSGSVGDGAPCSCWKPPPSQVSRNHFIEQLKGVYACQLFPVLETTEGLLFFL